MDCIFVVPTELDGVFGWVVLDQELTPQSGTEPPLATAALAVTAAVLMLG